MYSREMSSVFVRLTFRMQLSYLYFNPSPKLSSALQPGHGLFSSHTLFFVRKISTQNNCTDFDNLLL